MRIAIGPSKHYPSWHWCAGDLIPDLKTRHNITVFRRYSELKNHDFDLLVAVKFPPPNEFQAKSRIIYLPIDYFRDEPHIAKHSAFLRSCDTIAIHCARLADFLKPHCKKIEFIEHYGKYALPRLADFNPKGIVIWTGMCTFVGLVERWYNSKPRNFRLVVLTNRIRRIHLQDHSRISLEPWTERNQRRYFKGAKAGLDVKGSDFAQQMKPPTKIQQLVASGIPAAVNPNSYTWEYFHERGLNLSDPDDTERWFSETYWREIRNFAPKLRQAISKTNVVQSYLNLIDRA